MFTKLPIIPPPPLVQPPNRDFAPSLVFQSAPVGVLGATRAEREDPSSAEDSGPKAVVGIDVANEAYRISKDEPVPEIAEGVNCGLSFDSRRHGKRCTGAGSGWRSL